MTNHPCDKSVAYLLCIAPTRIIDAHRPTDEIVIIVAIEGDAETRTKHFDIGTAEA